jgi:hypothetical protein
MTRDDETRSCAQRLALIPALAQATSDPQRRILFRGTGCVCGATSD